MWLAPLDGNLDDVSSFDERRRARANWPVRKVTLGDEELTDARDASTVDERLALVWALTRQQWALAGRELPHYSRASMPGRMIRGRR
jgi:hypothetical protein